MTDTPKQSPYVQEQAPDLGAKDPYRVLGVAPTATIVEIKRAYFALIRDYPPETEGETFKIIRGAYEKVKSAKRRTETDIFLPKAPPVWDPSQISLMLDTNFYPLDARLVLEQWGDLGRSNFQEDFKEIEL